MAGLPTVPYLTVQYRILTPVLFVPENVPFLSVFRVNVPYFYTSVPEKVDRMLAGLDV